MFVNINVLYMLCLLIADIFVRVQNEKNKPLNTILHLFCGVTIINDIE